MSDDVVAARTSALAATVDEFEAALWRQHWRARDIPAEERELRIRELIADYLASDELDDIVQELAVELLLYRNDLLATPIPYRLTETN